MNVTDPATVSPQPRTVSPKAQTAPAISSDFTTFLTMLTTQIQNQDPLNPMKSEEFAVQLATFSSVEQQVKTNDLLSAMQFGGGADRFSNLTSWIGREVRAAIPADYRGEPVTFHADPAIAGERHAIVVKDSAGIEIDRLPVSAAGGSVVWSGNTPTGPAPDGYYTATLESFDQDTVVAEASVSTYSVVSEVRRGGDGPMLVLSSGQELPTDQVTAVRAAQFE